MTRKQSTKKVGAKGKAEGSNGKTGQPAETPDKAATNYAQRAYDAALAHFEANQRSPFALSRLAVIYGESKPGDFNMVVTLPGSWRDLAVSDEALHAWAAHVEMLCRTLEHPNCSDAFRGAFNAVFTDNILADSRASWTTPAVVRVMLPLALMDMVLRCDGVPEDMLAILQTLREELNDDEMADAVRESVVGV